MLKQTTEYLGRITIGSHTYHTQCIRTGSASLIYIFRADNLALRGLIFPTREAFQAWHKHNQQLVLF